LESILEGLLTEREQLEQFSKEEINLEKRIAHFRKVLENNEILKTFDRCVFRVSVEALCFSQVIYIHKVCGIANVILQTFL
jgi:site-specific DNA recombinase